MAFSRTLQHFTSSQELATIWASGQSYIVNQLVLNNNLIYRCLIANTSSASFATDLGAGKWVEVSASAAGTKNYISNSNFEQNTTTGWSLFNTTLTSKIPTGSITAGAASITSFAVDSTTPIAGTYDLRVASSGVLAAGQGFISDAFTIDREDQAKPLTFSFAYEAVSGTMDFSGTSNNTFAVYIYDVSGSAWIQPAGVYNLVQSSGVGIASGSFQTTATGTQYRIAVICITATSGAVEMRFDDFQLGPQKVLAGAAVSDWVSFTPTGSWVANTTYTGRWKRVGDSVQVQASLSLTGAPTATRLTINLPSGLVIDNTKRSGGSGATINNIFGTGKTFDGATAVHNLTVAYESTTAVAVSYESTATAQLNNVTNTTPFAYNSGDVLDIEYTVPISGWSSNTVLSQDTDTRVVALTVSKTTTQSITSAGGAQAVVSWASATNDTHSSFNSTTGEYTVPVSGFYRVSGNINFASNSTSGRFVFIQLDGVRQYLAGIPAVPSPYDTRVPFAGDVYCIAGQKLRIAVDQTSGGALNIAANPDTSETRLSISRISGPATIAASETVAMRRNSTSGQTINSAVTSIVNFETAGFDTHSAWRSASGAYNAATGTWATTNPGFVAPVSGVYLVAGCIGFDATSAFFTTVAYNIVRVNGTAIFTSSDFFTANGTIKISSFSGLVRCLAGDVIDVVCRQETGAARNLQAYTSDRTCLTIVRVGN